MSTFQFRPTFSCATHQRPQEFIRRVKDWVHHHGEQYEGQFASEYAMVGSTGKQRHFWSPWLQLEVRQTEAGRVVFGRFTPHPSVWTGIMFSYLVVILSIFFGVMFAISQQLSGETAWGYLTIPVGAGVALALWLVSRIGQNLSLAEMRQLQTEIERIASEPSATRDIAGQNQTVPLEPE